MTIVKIKGKRGIVELKQAERCASHNCFKPPVKDSRYCRTHRKEVKADMEWRRWKEFPWLRPKISASGVFKTNLYAIAAGTEAVKFGVAKDVQRRLLALQTGNHVALELLASIKCDAALEGLVHEYLEEHWVIGEWHELKGRSWQVIELMRANNGRALVELVSPKEPLGWIGVTCN